MAEVVGGWVAAAAAAAAVVAREGDGASAGPRS